MTNHTTVAVTDSLAFSSASHQKLNSKKHSIQPTRNE